MSDKLIGIALNPGMIIQVESSDIQMKILGEAWKEDNTVTSLDMAAES